MKVLLVNPPIRDFYNTPLRRQPLGLLYLAAVLRKDGHSVRLLDSGACHRAQRIPIPEPFQKGIPDSDAWDASPFKLFGRYYHFGYPFSDIEAFAREWRPHVIGLSSLFNAYAEETLSCAERMKKAVPDSILVLGGGHPSSNAESVLQNPAVDYLVQGEGEKALAALLNAIASRDDPSNIPGICGRGQDGALFRNAPEFIRDISALPWPARDLLDLNAYRMEGRPLAHILSSRGCPFRCAFCSAHLTTGGRFRPRRPEEVVEEMRDCRDRFGFEAFDFEDDHLTADPERAAALMQQIIAAFGEDKLWLGAMNGLSAMGMSSELLDLMRRAGFRNLNFSPLAGDGSTRDAMGRPESLQEVQILCRAAANFGFNITVYLMVGYPGLSLESTMQQVALWAKEPVLLAPSVFYPAPGSKIQEALFPSMTHADASQWALTRSSLFPCTPNGLSRRESRTVFWMIRVVNFCGAASPDKDTNELRDRCAPWISRLRAAGTDARGTRTIVSSNALDADARGFAALAGGLLSRHPQGIRLVRRGSEDRDWEYAVFPLENMIEDEQFYGSHGIPGFDAVFDG